jgi:CRP-like cAMP-binding protein
VSFTNNLFLDALTDTVRQALTPHLARLELKQHKVLYDIGEAVTRVYFAIDAVVSLVVPLSTGEVVEIAMVGRDGIVGAAAAHEGLSLNRAVAQIGGRSLACEIETFKCVLAKHPPLQRSVGAHEQVKFSQAQQSAACNATHDLESRLARWLLRAADLHGSNELPLTQEFLSQILGSRRTSVTMIARTLQFAGMIKYVRGHIKLLDIPALQETACECYQTVKLNYDALIQAESNQSAQHYRRAYPT